MGDMSAVVLAAASQAEGNFLLPNGTFFVVLIIFLIVLGVIGTFVVPPISKVLKERDNMVTKTAGGNRLSLTLTPSQGLVRGNAFDVNSGRTVSFSGALLQNLGYGSGFFLNTNLCGQVYFGP